MGVPFLGDCTDLFLRSGWTALQTCTHAQRLVCSQWPVGNHLGSCEEEVRKMGDSGKMLQEGRFIETFHLS